jgi:lysozyme
MALDPEYLDAIKGFEGYAPAASWDYKQYSSGYGTKAQPGDENIPPDQLKAVYEQRFQDETSRAASSVDAFAPNLPAGVRAALTSLTYNAGPGWQQSGLGQAVQSGDWDKAREIFLQYNKAGGEVNPVLVARRQKEAAWFGGGLPAAQPQTASVTPASPPSAPLQAIPQPAAPIFAQAQPQAQPQQAQAGGSLFGQMPAEQAMQAPPIFYAPRRSPDLSKLRAAFSQPVFSRG